MLYAQRGWHLSRLQGHDVMAEKFEPANDATDETGRKTWRTPLVIVGALDETETNPVIGPDGFGWS